MGGIEIFFLRMGCWVTKNLNRNFHIPEIWVPENFGLGTIYYFVDLKFRVPEPKSLLVWVPKP